MMYISNIIFYISIAIILQTTNGQIVPGYYTGVLPWNETTTLGTKPSKRFSQTSIYHKDNMIVFGGREGGSNKRLNDVWKFNLITNTWNEVTQISGTKPPKRYWHTAISNNDNMYVFGGLDYLSGSWTGMNDLYKFNLNTNTWTEIVSGTTTKPSIRGGHTAIYQNEKMTIFGGNDPKTGSLDDVWNLNLNTNEWKKISTSGADKPGKCFGHNAVYYNFHMYVFGCLNNDIYRLYLLTNTWSKKSNAVNSAKAAISLATSILYDNLWIVFGGSNNANNDAYSFDLLHEQSSILTTSGTKPSGRTAFSSIFYNKKMIIFGGKASPASYPNNDVFVLNLNGLPTVKANTGGGGGEDSTQASIGTKITYQHIFTNSILIIICIVVMFLH